MTNLEKPAGESEGRIAELETAIDQALMSLSGALCYRTAEAKHCQVRDAYATLAKAHPKHTAPKHENSQ